MSVSLHGQAGGVGDASTAPQPVSTALLPWARLIGGLSSIEAVTKIGIVTANESVDLWVVLRDDDDAAETEVSRLEREYRVAVGAAPFELYVAALTMIDQANLPPFETIFSR